LDIPTAGVGRPENYIILEARGPQGVFFFLKQGGVVGGVLKEEGRKWGRVLTPRGEGVSIKGAKKFGR